MRALLALVLALLCTAAGAQTVSISRWQDLAPLLDRQSKAINALKVEVATLKAEHNKATDYALQVICRHNANVAKVPIPSEWVTILRPYDLQGRTCPPLDPTLPMPQRIQ